MYSMSFANENIKKIQEYEDKVKFYGEVIFLFLNDDSV